MFSRLQNYKYEVNLKLYRIKKYKYLYFLWKMIDLRSDTVTKPTAEMLDYMMRAKVGDDVFEDDPTVNELQAMLAERFGMEAALFVPSGTMSNQVAIKAHTVPGDEVICSEQSHIYKYEGGGIAMNAGASVKLLPGDSGLLTAEQVEAGINPDDVHFPKSTLVSLENTSNRGGGVCYKLEEIEKIATLVKQHKLKIHLDGARLYNALVATGQGERDYGNLFDSISICLSKGLGAPVGSVLLGDREFIRKSRRIRKVFGGGMRQAGYLAAAGIYALENNVGRLEEDHKHADLLASAASRNENVISCEPVETNIVVMNLNDRVKVPDFLNQLEQNGILAVAFGPQKVRLVTHLGLSGSDIERACVSLSSH
jgi:threonine aldolase